MSDTSTTTYRTPLLSKRPGICGGDWCVEGTRIRRQDVRAQARLLGWRHVRDAYPHLSDEAVAFCLARFRRDA